MKSALLTLVLLSRAPMVQATRVFARTNGSIAACVSEDMEARAMLQNKLAGICLDMCKEVGAYPEGCTCPGYTDPTDKTPGVVTWEELLKYMGDLASWGKETHKANTAMSALQHKVR